MMVFAARRSDRRTTGRVVLTGVALAAVLLAGCGTPSQPTPPDSGNGSSAPANQTSQPTTPDPTSRSVTADNLLGTGDIPNNNPDAQAVVESPDGAGRPPAQSYLCMPPDGLSTLGATAMVTRSFSYRIGDAELDFNPDSPLKNQPVIFTQALQFPDEAAAARARATYAGWIKDCPATLTEQGYAIDSGQSLPLTTLDVEGAQAQAGMVAYVKPGEDDVENLYWESAAVTQVGDRLMLTVSLNWGMDTPGTFDDTEGDSDFINPQVTLVEEATTRLAA